MTVMRNKEKATKKKPWKFRSPVCQVNARLTCLKNSGAVLVPIGTPIPADAKGCGIHHQRVKLLPQKYNEELFYEHSVFLYYLQLLQSFGNSSCWLLREVCSFFFSINSTSNVLLDTKTTHELVRLSCLLALDSALGGHNDIKIS